MSKGALPDSAGTTGELQRRLFELIAGLARETHPNRPLAGTVTPQTRLDRDLGLDSMTRAELLLRMEREFGVEVPESAIAAETAADVLAALVRSLGR
ncbi:MAG: acyl carrier protein, partial [Ectothiorhodospiraceae bacterium]